MADHKTSTRWGCLRSGVRHERCSSSCHRHRSRHRCRGARHRRRCRGQVRLSLATSGRCADLAQGAAGLKVRSARTFTPAASTRAPSAEGPAPGRRRRIRARLPPTRTRRYGCNGPGERPTAQPLADRLASPQSFRRRTEPRAGITPGHRAPSRRRVRSPKPCAARAGGTSSGQQAAAARAAPRLPPPRLHGTYSPPGTGPATAPVSPFLPGIWPPPKVLQRAGQARALPDPARGRCLSSRRGGRTPTTGSGHHRGRGHGDRG